MMTNTLPQPGRLLCLVPVAVLFLAVSALADEPARWWTWNGFMTEAAFVSTKDDGSVVKLRKVSGREVDIAVDRLSDEDKRYVKEHRPVPSPPSEEKQPVIPRPTTQKKERTTPETPKKREDESAKKPENDKRYEKPSSNQYVGEGYFIYFGEKLRMSNSLYGVRLGDEVKNYTKNRQWTDYFEVSKSNYYLNGYDKRRHDISDYSFVFLYPYSSDAVVESLSLCTFRGQTRICSLYLTINDCGVDAFDAATEALEKQFKFTGIKDGKWNYESTTEPKISINAWLKGSRITVAYHHDQMFMLELQNSKN